MQTRFRIRAVAPVLLAGLLSSGGVSTFARQDAAVTRPAALKAGQFANPVCRNAADPWVVYRDGSYYMTRTVGWGVAIRKSPTLAGLAAAKDVEVWRGGGPGYETFHRDVWAPELHFLRGKWYVYYTATDGPDANRRVFCLESKTADPFGEYTFKGKVSVPNDDAYAIDATIYERPSDKKLFLLWSGREASTKSAQNIYIAPMSDPWTISGPRIRLSSPNYPWERHGWLVNEGPEVLTQGGKTFVVYSASGGTTANYCLGLLTNTDGDLLNPTSWTKSEKPVFASYEGPDGRVYTPGHNGFFQSPDGKEWWIIYHGKEERDNTWRNRHARAQKFTWRPDGTPDFGRPIPAGVPLDVPSGEVRIPDAVPVRN